MKELVKKMLKDGFTIEEKFHCKMNGKVLINEALFNEYYDLANLQIAGTFDCESFIIYKYDKRIVSYNDIEDVKNFFKEYYKEVK